tara:strand:+ start:842 stop:1129 length:288 start_codon:yes stop_codon:yes gene_type:complete
MKVKELIERVGAESLPTGRALAYIKDGLEELNISSETNFETIRNNIVQGKRYYDMPKDMVQVLDIRAKNHLNTKAEYRSIPRLINEPITKDEDGV